ncbi:MAG: TetR/AcrR family transcriptional regulator [Candidatus Lambdaproteobacteria bacterium]|nr:TetR/AcrR family transcriptional regulator [Candidatus Lambdaproteobacteria bacterium]
MRYRPEHKEATRARILRSAGRLMRRKGIGSTSVEALMRASGLSHGGFYAYFASKGALVAETVRAAMRESGRFWLEGLGEAGRDWLPLFLGRYLNRKHLERQDIGCPMPALAAEVARSPEEVKRAFEQELRGLIGLLARQPADAADPRELALATISLSVGGILLARAVADPVLADDILRACRRVGRTMDKPPADGSAGSAAGGGLPQEDAPGVDPA